MIGALEKPISNRRNAYKKERNPRLARQLQQQQQRQGQRWWKTLFSMEYRLEKLGMREESSEKRGPTYREMLDV